MTSERDVPAGILFGPGPGQKLIEFSLGDQGYGVTIDQVREVINADLDIAPVPEALPAIEGAINVRGRIIPLINLARMLHLEAPAVGRIMISEFASGPVAFGVTAVGRLHTVPWTDLASPAELLQPEQRYVVAIARIEERTIYVLDLARLALRQTS